MSIRLKTKLTVGLVFLFCVIVLFGVLGLFYINRLSTEGRLVLQNNHESLVYCNRMLQSLEDLQTDKNVLAAFWENLQKQQKNITEVREKEATDDLARNFNELRVNPVATTNFSKIPRSIYKIQTSNKWAMVRKNPAEKKTAKMTKAF